MPMPDISIAASIFPTEDENRISQAVLNLFPNANITIEGNMLNLGEKDFLPVSFLKQTYGITLNSNPVVFLNGCSSGEIKNLWHKHDNLATEFLDCGASACVVTNYQIPEISAKNFAQKFYFYFINQKLTVGQSLQQARLDMAKPEFSGDMNPDYDITRYLYNLYGEPRILF